MTTPTHAKTGANDPRWDTATRYLWFCIGGFLLGAGFTQVMIHFDVSPWVQHAPPVESPSPTMPETFPSLSTACTVEVIDGLAVVSCVG